jgi:hypothetical protein
MLCLAKWSVDLTGTHPVKKFAKMLGITAEANFGFNMMSNHWNMPKDLVQLECDGEGCKMTTNDNQPCRKGLEEFMGIDIGCDDEGCAVPAFAKKLNIDKYVKTSISGQLKFTHGHCIEARPGWSLDDARAYTDFISLTGSMVMGASMRFCTAGWAGGIKFNAMVEGGVEGELKIHYLPDAGKMRRQSGGRVYGYVKGALDVQAYAAFWSSCKCKKAGVNDGEGGIDAYGNQEMRLAGHGCHRIIGGSGAFEISVEFVDLQIGDGPDGVDVSGVQNLLFV